MKHRLLCAALGALAVALSGAASAAEQRYVVQGSLTPFGAEYPTSNSYVEVWGFGAVASAIYANPATFPGDPFHHLLAGPDAASQGALGGYVNAGFGVSYDPAAAPYFVSASGNTARYTTGGIQVVMSGPGLVSQELSASDTYLSVGRSTSPTTQQHNQSLAFIREASTVEGPIPGSSFSYAGPAASTSADLVELLGASAAYYPGHGQFDLSSFAALPVRLIAPTVFRPVGFTVGLRRSNNDSGGAYGIEPPAALDAVNWNGTATLEIYFDGVYGVTVDAADYTTEASYLAASNWVTANIRQINYEQALVYDFVGISAVPEPAAAWLLLAGIAALMLRARRHRTS